MDFSDLLKSLLGITDNFSVVEITTNKSLKEIEMRLKYISNRYKLDNVNYQIYDVSPERCWQHLN